MKVNEVIELFFKGLDDVLMSLGTGGNKYEVCEVRFMKMNDAKSSVGEQDIVLWGKVEKEQGMILLFLNDNEVRALIGSVEGTIPEDINESVLNTLKELGDAFLGGGLSSLAQLAKKGVVQFESTGILRGNEVFESPFSSRIEDPVIYGSVKVEGSIHFTSPWRIIFDNLLKGWFSIDEENENSAERDPMLAQEGIESFLNNELLKTEIAKREIEKATTGVKPVSTKSTDSRYRNLDVILDIQVEATARLGSVEMPLATVLSLGPGSVINVGHEVDNPIELYVNNKLIAKGDVVIVDEKFGIRITEIVSPQERIESLQ